MAVAKPELGIKRICGNCGTKFYDLARDPILCPKCGTIYEIVAVPIRASAAKAAPVVAVGAGGPGPRAPVGAGGGSPPEGAEAQTKKRARQRTTDDVRRRG